MTGLVDHRVRGNSVLVLTCLCTGSRRIAADRSLQATAADRIVSAHQDLELAQHGVAHEIREVIVQRVAIRLQDPALPALADIENSPIFAACKSGAQTGPAAAPEAGHRARGAWRSPPSRSTNASSSPMAAAHSAPPRTQSSPRGLGAERRGAQPQRLLAVPVNGNEFPQRFYRVLMAHALLLRAASLTRMRRRGKETGGCSSRRCAMWPGSAPGAPPAPPARPQAGIRWAGCTIFTSLYLFTERWRPRGAPGTRLDSGGPRLACPLH